MSVDVNIPGLGTTRADDWRAAYVDSDTITVLAGIGWISFALASSSAKVTQQVILSSIAYGFDVEVGKIIQRLRKAFGRVERVPANSPLFWPLDVPTKFSIHDLQGALGKAAIVAVGTKKFIQVSAWRESGQVGPDGYEKPAGTYFSHHGIAIPVDDQFIDLSATAIKWGHWDVVRTPSPS